MASGVDSKMGNSYQTYSNAIALPIMGRDGNQHAPIMREVTGDHIARETLANGRIANPITNFHREGDEFAGMVFPVLAKQNSNLSRGRVEHIVRNSARRKMKHFSIHINFFLYIWDHKNFLAKHKRYNLLKRL